MEHTSRLVTPPKGPGSWGHAFLSAAPGALVLGAPGLPCPPKPSGKGMQVPAVGSWAGQQGNGKSQEDVGGALMLSALSSCVHFHPGFLWAQPFIADEMVQTLCSLLGHPSCPPRGGRL